LFDGETALRSSKVKKEIWDRYQVEIFAQPGYRRNMAERHIKEFKLRTTIFLKERGKSIPFLK